jgi:c-di-GMP-binding flagellar brake protein YcgR
VDDAIQTDRPLEIQADEAVIAELDAYLLRGLMAWHVRLTLTDRRAQFRPTHRLERLAGARGDGFYIDEMTEATWSRVTQQLTITLGERTIRLSGGEVHLIYKHLNAILDPDAIDDEVDSINWAFLPGERLLLQGTVDVVVRDPLWASGEIQLTNRRIRFKPGRGVQRLLVSGKPVEINLEELDGIRISRGGTGLDLLWHYEPEDGEEAVLEIALEMVRGSSSALAAAFLAMGSPKLLPGDSPPLEAVKLRPPMLLKPGRYGSTTLARTGTLAIGKGGIWFTSDDLVATVAGTSAEGLRFVEINRIEMDESNPCAATLHPRGGESSQRIETDQTALNTTTFALLMAKEPPTQGMMLDSQGRLDAKDVRNLVRMNSAILPEDRTPTGVLGAAAVRITRQKQIIRGWVIVLKSGLLFLPLGGRAEDRCYMDGPLIDRTRSNVNEDHILTIVVERREERFAICGTQAADELWRSLWSHLPDIRSMTDRYPYLDAIVGRISHLRLSHRQKEVLSRRMLGTVLERDGLGFQVGGWTPDILSVGTDIEIEMGNQEVVYCFRTHIARIDQNDDGDFMVIGLSTKVKRRDNRRQAFRVAMDQLLSMHKMASHTSRPNRSGLPASLTNVSWTGLAVLLEEAHPVGTLFTMQMDLEDRSVDFTMEIIHNQRLPGESRILHGCRFLNLSAGEEDHIQSALIRHQMREANIREFGLSHDRQEASDT